MARAGLIQAHLCFSVWAPHKDAKPDLPPGLVQKSKDSNCADVSPYIAVVVH